VGVLSPRGQGGASREPPTNLVGAELPPPADGEGSGTRAQGSASQNQGTRWEQTHLTSTWRECREASGQGLWGGDTSDSKGPTWGASGVTSGHWMILTRTCGSPTLAPPDHLGTCDHLLLAVLFDAGYVGLDKYWPTAIIKQRRVPGEPRVDWSHFDADRACVECFFGRLKRTFWILRDYAFRLEWSKLEPSVTFCVAMLNFRHRFRGYALSSPPPGFQRAVPISADPPPGASLRGLAFPPAHRPDDRVGLTPGRAFQILRHRREEEVQLLLDSFEVPCLPPRPRGLRTPTQMDPLNPIQWVVPHAVNGH
jgi:hypothetical protein